ncbi:hypothetical protein GYH30_047665 [Glycine max]|nr:hypothetical protein GYH30_047665 [Glycine max]
MAMRRSDEVDGGCRPHTDQDKEDKLGEATRPGLDCERGGEEGGVVGDAIGGDDNGDCGREWRFLKKNWVATMVIQVGLTRGERRGSIEM